MAKLITARDAHETFHYDSESGALTRKRRGNGGALCWTDSDGYIVVRVKGRAYMAHRVIWLILYGDWPECVIDHINGTRSDNRKCNLREASFSQNQWNRKIDRRNSSGIKGVSWCKQTKKWRAQIMVKNKAKCLGRYDRMCDAAKARIEAALIFFGSFANEGGN